MENGNNGKRIFDTRNRWQRMNDANYENKPLSKAEVCKRFKDQTELNHLKRLSNEFGFTKRHPRTYQLIQMHTSDVSNAKQQPRTAYQRKQNAIRGRITVSIIKGKVENVAIDTVNESVATWRSVWYSKHNRRK